MQFLRLFIFFVLVWVSSTESPLSPIDLTKCGETKSCLMSSENCGTNTCNQLAAWRIVQKTTANQLQQYLEVEMSGFVNKETGYVAIGFSDDVYMGDDSTVACFSDSGRLSIRMGWNSGSESKRSNSFLKQNTDAVMLTTINSTSPNYLGVYFNSLSKRIECRFQLLLKAPITFKDSDTVFLKDLSQPTHVMFVRGDTTKPNEGMSYHNLGKMVSQQALDLNKIGVVPEARGRAWAKVHACFMILAWLGCASIGILLARYFKPMWPKKKFGREKVWFQAHRVLMLICLVLTVVSFIIIFAVVGGYSNLATLPQKAHPILGIIVTIFTVLNPLLALCRCSPEHKDRPWFNWFHWFFGSVAYVLAIPTIFIGLRMDRVGSQLVRLDYPVWILIFFVLFQFAVEIILEIHGCMVYKKDKDKRQDYQYKMDKYNQVSGPAVRPLEPQPTGSRFKSFMLTLHICVTVIVTFILIIVVAVN